MVTERNSCGLARRRMQVQAEMVLGMMPMPHMNAKDERVQCLLEISFIDAVVAPLWEHLALLFPALQPCVLQIQSNRSSFQRLTQRRTHSIKEVRCLVQKPHLKLPGECLPSAGCKKARDAVGV